MSERMAIVLYENKNVKKGTDETESLLGLERNIYICILLEIIVFNLPLRLSYWITFHYLRYLVKIIWEIYTEIYLVYFLSIVRIFNFSSIFEKLIYFVVKYSECFLQNNRSK